VELKDKVAIVTGAAQGFGLGIAELFASNGAAVVLADVNVQAGEAAAAAIAAAGGRSRFLKADVTKASDWKTLVAAAAEGFGRLDIVVNNAGISHVRQPMLEVDEAMFDRVFAVNVKSIYLSAIHAVPVLKAQKSGVIVNIASTAGIRPRPGLTWYNGSKAAVIGLTRSMAIELAPDRVRVVAINPVAGETPLLATFMGGDTPENRAEFVKSVPLGRLSTPRDVAEAALFLASDRASLVTGLCMEVDGGRCI
jgi:3-oxoacyl-[acyl-carrier protein] reductase